MLVELKQWQQATLTGKDAVVVTPFSGKPQETAHPFTIDKRSRVVYTIKY